MYNATSKLVGKMKFKLYLDEKNIEIHVYKWSSKVHGNYMLSKDIKIILQENKPIFQSHFPLTF